jgi:hypothetical protein
MVSHRRKAKAQTRLFFWGMNALCPAQDAKPQTQNSFPLSVQQRAKRTSAAWIVWSPLIISSAFET